MKANPVIRSNNLFASNYGKKINQPPRKQKQQKENLTINVRIGRELVPCSTGEQTSSSVQHLIFSSLMTRNTVTTLQPKPKLPSCISIVLRLDKNQWPMTKQYDTTLILPNRLVYRNLLCQVRKGYYSKMSSYLGSIYFFQNYRHQLSPKDMTTLFCFNI